MIKNIIILTKTFVAITKRIYIMKGHTNIKIQVINKITHLII